jgi:elongation factor G
VQPNERGAGVQIVDQAKAEWLTDVYRKELVEGAREAMRSGVLQGYEVDDVLVTVLGAEQKVGASKPVAYRIAASKAVRHALTAAKPMLLGPHMKVEVTVPPDHVGEVIGSLNAARGRIMDVEDRGSVNVVRADVPLERMFGYSTTLRSLTQGRGSFIMMFSHYDI